jgi:hypothetical protein
MTLSAKEISDRMEIEQLLVRYCYAIDQRDWDAYRQVYTDDAVIDDVSAGPGNSVHDMVEFLARAPCSRRRDPARNLHHSRRHRW